MLFMQIRSEGDNFSYILADEATGYGVVIDPSKNGEAIEKVVKDKGLKLGYILFTHQHPDHVGDAYELKKRLGGLIAAHRLSSVIKDVSLDDGDLLEVGSVRLKILHTPGHTPDGICILADGKLMTGDTLFVGECGRTDLPGGDPSKMYDSLRGKISALGDEVEVYPGHDYGLSPSSTIGEEKRSNYVLKDRTREEFIAFMEDP
jgi:hydroxyacylglutathione hydrolase